ncbi:MAG: FtsX-like permease family protein [Gammaproteobacteria bacterium]|nr:FtsX-like permease family protein [Gammaproteobacteria bacterium]
MFDVDAILSQVRLLMEQVIRAVEYVFGFTVLAGVIVLFAALQTTQDERKRESALLSALGANRRQILGGLLAEFTCLGLVAGTLAAVGASLVAWVLADYVFNMPVAINTPVLVYGPLLSMAIIVAGGLAGTRQVLATPPMHVLRQV